MAAQAPAPTAPAPAPARRPTVNTPKGAAASSAKNLLDSTDEEERGSSSGNIARRQSAADRLEQAYERETTTEEDEEDAQPQEDEMRHLSRSEDGDDDFRSSVKTHVESLDERLKRMETAESELERTIASAVRELAGDLMRAYRGEEPEFAYRYADRYDLALTRSGTKNDHEDEQEAEKEEGEEDHASSDFRGGHEMSSRRHSSETRSRYQDEKDSFDLESLSFDVKESSVLSD